MKQMGVIILLAGFLLFAGASKEAQKSTDSVVLESFERAASIIYREDFEDYWQSPEETLESGYGDCEDKALLLHDLLSRHGLASEVVFGVEDREESTQFHAWVECRFGKRLYVMDATNGFIGRRPNMPSTSYMPVLGQPKVKEKLARYIQRTGQSGINRYYEHILKTQEAVLADSDI